MKYQAAVFQLFKEDLKVNVKAEMGCDAHVKRELSNKVFFTVLIVLITTYRQYLLSVLEYTNTVIYVLYNQIQCLINTC